MLLRLNDLYGRLLEGLALLGCVVLFAMMSVICIDVGMRNLGISSLAWANEVSEYALYLMVFLAAPWLLRKGSHVRMDMVLMSLPPALAWVIEWVIDIVCFVICVTLAWSSLTILLASHSQGNIVIKAVIFPEWWSLIPLPVTFLLLAIEFLFRMYRLTRGERTARTEATSVA
jgi:TRAP-type C4-dicarboxylate transport system permease small subunit